MKSQPIESCPMDISDDDILKAMKEISGYLDITPGDFKEIYRFAYRHAVERLRHSVKAKEVMTGNVIFVKRDTLLQDVADILNRHLISGVPVIDDHRRVVGIVSEKDFLFHMGARDKRTFMGVVSHCLKSKGCVAISMRKQKAEDIMSSPAITVSEHADISIIANTFADKNINRVPVTGENNKLIGIVTRNDVVKASCYMDHSIESEE